MFLSNLLESKGVIVFLDIIAELYKRGNKFAAKIVGAEGDYNYSSLEKEIAQKTGINKSEQAKLVGARIAEKALEKGISSVVFDRNGFLYHGRIKSLADAARKGGLKF